MVIWQDSTVDVCYCQHSIHRISSDCPPKPWLSTDCGHLTGRGYPEIGRPNVCVDPQRTCYIAPIGLITPILLQLAHTKTFTSLHSSHPYQFISLTSINITLCLTCVMFLDDMDQLIYDQADLVGLLPLIVGQHPILFQVLHLVRVRDNGLQSCKGEGQRSCDQAIRSYDWMNDCMLRTCMCGCSHKIWWKELQDTCSVIRGKWVA